MEPIPQGAALVPWLQQNSLLPGPRANLELLSKFVLSATDSDVDQCLDVLAKPIPTDHPDEFVAMCGVVASGRLFAHGDTSKVTVIRNAARHPSLRIRDAAVMALHEIGKVSLELLITFVKSWENPSHLDRRCITVGLCDPLLLKQPSFNAYVLETLDEIIQDLEREKNTKSEDYKFLKKALGYCLGIALAAEPEAGKVMFEQWMQSPSLEIRWILNENLKKNRLVQMDPDWVATQIEFLNDADG